MPRSVALAVPNAVRQNTVPVYGEDTGSVMLLTGGAAQKVCEPQLPQDPLSGISTKNNIFCQVFFLSWI